MIQFQSGNTCEYGIIVLPLSVDQSKKMETNAFIKMAQFYNNLIMKRSRRKSRKLTTFYKMHNKVCPQYLCNCLPSTVSSISDHIPVIIISETMKTIQHQEVDSECL